MMGVENTLARHHRSEKCVQIHTLEKDTLARHHKSIKCVRTHLKILAKKRKKGIFYT
jgi:hypothetical protein